MIYKQSVFELWPVENESVQAIICSPPYYNLRKYHIPDVVIGGNKDCKHVFGENIIERKRGNVSGSSAQVGVQKSGICGTSVNHGSNCIYCNAWKGQYGNESTLATYVEHTRLWAKEAWRVLRNDGIFFLNLADSYAGGRRGYGGKASYLQGEGVSNPKLDYQDKCQLLIPHHVAIALVEDGWILRNTICWFKSNAMPESVTDRFSKKYEYIFMLTKSPDYYFDLDGVREPHKEVSIERLKRAVSNQNKWVNGASGQQKHGLSQPRHNYKERIGSMQSSEFQNADYLVGKLNSLGKNPGDVWQIPTQSSSEKHFAMWPERLVERMIKCSTKPGDAVLDCFAGSGTTLKIAEQLQRKGIGIDLGYHEISKRRTSKIQKQMFV